MVPDKLDKLGPLFNEVGGEIAEIVGGNADGAYLYAELSGGSVAAGVFHDDGKAIRYFDPTRPLNELLIEAWESENTDESKRFAVVEYAVVGGRFKVEFQYPEEMKRGEFIDDRRERALVKRYGDRQVIYPPIPEGWTKLKQ
jgi:hypothetical protein